MGSGQWDEAGFAFYDGVLEAMSSAGIRPMLALDQWVYPAWVAERGGWANPDIIDLWVANARVVVDRYASLCPIWISFADFAAYIKWEVQDSLPVSQIARMASSVVAAHKAVYEHIHTVQPSAQVTMSLNVVVSPMHEVTDNLILDQVRDHLDFLGVANYSGFTAETLPGLGRRILPDPRVLSNPLTVDVVADSLYHALTYCARRFPGTPLYVVDSGMVTLNGAPREGYERADHLRDTVYWLQRAQQDGIEILGYNYWGLTDSFEWGTFEFRTGLYTVNVVSDPTLTRRPTAAASAYRDIVAARGVPQDYRPTRAPSLCSFTDVPAGCVDPVIMPR